MEITRKLLSTLFEHWNRPGELGTHRLCELLGVQVEAIRKERAFSDDLRGRAKALQTVIQLAIESIGVDGETPPGSEDDPKWTSKEWRHRNILTLLQSPEASPSKIADRIGLAEGGHFRDEMGLAYTKLGNVLCAYGKREPVAHDERPAPIGALHIDDPRYVHRQADTLFRQVTKNLGETLIIRGPMQVGKTSLLLRITNYLAQKYGAKQVYFDFQTNIEASDLTSLDLVLRRLTEQIIDDLKLAFDPEEFWSHQQQPAKTKLQRFLEHLILARFDAPIVLALDEVDLLMQTKFCRDFFAMLRAWHNFRAARPAWNKLYLVLAISTEPYLLIDDVYQSPFNVGFTLHLHDFNREQMMLLNRSYGSLLHETDVPSTMRLLNGHPYLTSSALYTMQLEKMSWADLEAVATAETGPFIGHLKYLQSHLEHAPALAHAFWQVIREQRCSDEQARFRLLKAGLIRVDGDLQLCRCQLYQRYFEKIFR